MMNSPGLVLARSIGFFIGCFLTSLWEVAFNRLHFVVESLKSLELTNPAKGGTRWVGDSRDKRICRHGSANRSSAS